jgi:hypothetical protein
MPVACCQGILPGAGEHGFVFACSGYTKRGTLDKKEIKHTMVAYGSTPPYTRLVGL